VIASGIFSQNKPDTLCVSMRTARRLAYYKLNFPKLDSTNRVQLQLINLLEKSLKGKAKMLDLCYLRNDELQKQIDLLKDREQKNIELTKIKTKRLPLFVRLKYVGIGFGIGALTVLVLHPP